MHKQTVKRLTTCAAVMIVGSLFGATRTEAIREKLMSGERDYVFVAMHRGDWRNFPENSKGVILSSIRLGADIVNPWGQVCIASRVEVKKLCTEVSVGTSADVSIRALRGSGGLESP